jgi:signal transduction histidine kinase
MEGTDGAGERRFAFALGAPAGERLHPASEFPGTGIGLTTVQRIVRRHGGPIWAEGVKGVGATFFFDLASFTEQPVEAVDEINEQ